MLVSLPYGIENNLTRVLSLDNTASKYVMQENIMPAINAVAMPLNVPVNSMGIPKVNKMSQRT